MKHNIDPTVDCVFKALLGKVDNRQPARMVYTWGDIYCKQLKRGDDFASLKPTYSIWLIGKKSHQRRCQLRSRL